MGLRGYPGQQGLTGEGSKGDKGDSGTNVTISDNGDGTFTITSADGSVVISNGKSPTKGTDFFDGNTGDFITFVYSKVLNGSLAPTITDSTGTFDGLLETMPTGPGVSWFDEPDYDLGFTTYVSSNRYKHDISTGGTGTWSLRNASWATPKIFTDAIAIQTQLISYAFIRDVSQPVAPTGGTFSNPIPTSPGWSDGVPQGASPVYMSKRLFTSDGLLPQDAGWTIPQLLGVSGSGVKFQFGPSNIGPFKDIPDPLDEWMITCKEDSSGIFVCDTLNPVRIKGEVGITPQTAFKAYAFKRSIGLLNEAPTGGDFSLPFPVDGLVTGWTNNIPAGTANLYVSTRLFTTDGSPPQDINWSDSQLFSGDSAKLFSITSDSQIFAFDTLNANPTPLSIEFTAIKSNISDQVNWTTDPLITYAAPDTGVDSFNITASEFGLLQSLKIIATANTRTDTIIIVRVKDGDAGVASGATEIREVRFQFAPDLSGAPGLWHNSPLVSTDDWIREGTFFDNILQGSFSAGTKITGNDGANTFTEFWFGDITAVGTPISDPLDWSQIQSASTAVSISRTTTLGIIGPWGAIVLIRGDDGVSGKFFETRFFKRSLALGPLTDPADYDKTISIPQTNLIDWVTSPNLLLTGDEVIWAITATKNFDNTLDTDWPDSSAQWGAYTPRRGTDYSDGTGVFLSKVYIEAANGFTTPPAQGTGSWDGSTEVLPSGGWVDDPFSPSPGNFIYESNFLYVSSLVLGVNTWPPQAGTWSAPAKYSFIPTLGTDYFNGTDGDDGDGSFHSYIFINAAIGIDLSTNPPLDGSYSGVGTEVIPAGWSDDPVTPSADSTTWITERTYVRISGVWQSPPAWADPSRFSALTSLVGILTNDTDSVVTDFTGANIAYTGNEGGQFMVFFGLLDVTLNSIFTIAGGSVSGSSHVLVMNGLQISIIQATGVYSLNGGSWSTDKETFTLVSTHIASGAITTKKYTLTKSKTGVAGVSGTANRLDIAYGDTSIGGAVNYPPNASSTNKTYIGTNVVTWIPPAAEPAVSLNNLLYEWTKIAGNNGISGFSTRVDFAYSQNAGGLGNVIYPTSGTVTPLPIHKYIGTNAVTWLATDIEPSVSTNRFNYEWAKFVGEDGASALTIINSVPAVSLPSIASGAVTNYSNSSNSISIFEGENKLTYNGVGTSAGTWRVSSIADININVGSITASNGDAIIGNANGMSISATSAFITFSLSGRRLDNTVFTSQTTQTFSKSEAGIQGSSSISASLSNASHSIPTDSSGNNGNYSGSGTVISLFEGVQLLNYNGSGATAGTWRVNTSTSNISAGSISDGGFVANVSNASNFSSGTAILTGSILFILTGRSFDGTSFSISVSQSFNKNLAAIVSLPTITTTSTPHIAFSHFSGGNPIQVSWSFGKSTTNINGNDPIGSSVLVRLFQGSTVVDSVTVFPSITQEPASPGEPALDFWSYSTGFRSTMFTSPAGNQTWIVVVNETTSSPVNITGSAQLIEP